MTPRVLQVIAGGRRGGAETFFTDLVLALRRAGLTQHAVIRRHRERAARLRGHGVEVTELPFGGPFDLRTRRGLGRVAAGYRPDVVQSWMNRASRFCPRGPYVRVGWLGGYYDLKYYQGCGHLVAITPGIVDYAVGRGWPAARIDCIPTFAADMRAAPVDRRTLETPGDAPLLLALGRLHPVKGFDVLLEALARVPEAYLWIAGEGELRSRLETLAHGLGVAPRVRFLGWRDDRAALLAAADICVVPSRYESFGTVLIEAWAAGRPVVAAAAPGPRELVADGSNGLLVPVDDARALADAIRRLIDDRGLRERLAGAGHAAYAAGFTESAVVERYLALYDRLRREGG